VIFGFDQGRLEVLLVEHGTGISKGKWGLPGGWIKEDEGIDNAANRLLRELTGIEDLYLEQLKAFGDPKRFPLGRVITIGYYALIKKADYDVKAGFTASDARWYTMDQIDSMIYDHNEILDYSLKHLRNRLRQAPIRINSLPKTFTLLQIIQMYQEVLQLELDISNFRRNILKMKFLADVK